MFDFLGGILTATATGGLTGVLGTGITAVMGHFERKQRHGQELELRRLDMELAKAEGAVAERVAAAEAAASREEAAGAALEASLKAAATRWSAAGDSGWIVFVDVVRGLTRPALTMALVALVAAIYFCSTDPGDELRGRIIDTVLYLATASTLWWFGARQLQRAEGGAK